MILRSTAVTVAFLLLTTPLAAVAALPPPDASQLEGAARDQARSALFAGPETAWTSLNMGPESGLDADTLDGYEATFFIAEDARLASFVNDGAFEGSSMRLGPWAVKAEEDSLQWRGNGTTLLNITFEPGFVIKGRSETGPTVRVINGYASTEPSHQGATVAGGGSERFPHVTTGAFAVIAGGHANEAARSAAVGGGFSNTAHYLGTVAGGAENEAGITASVAGGRSNTAGGDGAAIAGGTYNSASAQNAAVLGGSYNQATGAGAVVAGGESNTASAAFSFAAGRLAHAAHDGAFVWSGNGAFSSTAPQQFLVNAPGGVGLGTSAPRGQLDVAGNAFVDGAVVATHNAPAVPAAGAHYRDNQLLAWGKVSDDGSLVSGFGVAAASRLGVGHYRVTLTTPGATVAEMVPIATPEIDGRFTGLGAIRFVSVDHWAPHVFEIHVLNGVGAAVDNEVLFQVAGRPAP